MREKEEDEQEEEVLGFEDYCVEAWVGLEEHEDRHEGKYDYV